MPEPQQPETSHNVRLHLNGGRGAVSVDGLQLSGIKGFRLASTTGHLAVLELDLLLYEVEVDNGPAQVDIPKKTAETLLALGWLPPGALNHAYSERAALVALLASAYPAVIAVPGDPAWPVVYIDTPAGQLSWHLSSADAAAMFPHVPVVETTDPRAHWDGHDTPTKYGRLAELARMTRTSREDAARAT